MGCVPFRYNGEAVVGQVATPLLITAPGNEQFFPGQPGELFDLLRNAA